MFKDLGTLGMVRTTAQAFGFYLAYLCVAVVVAMLIGVAIGLTLPNPGEFTQGIGVGAVTAGIICAGLAFFMLKKKNLLGTFSSVVLIIATAALALLGGGILGMIIPAYLSTKPASAPSF